MANGNGKKKSKRFLYILGAVAIVILITLGLVAATRGGSKIDPSKLAKVERGHLAKRAYERAQQMAKDGVVSTSTLDDAQKNYELAVNKQKLGQANVISAAAKLRQAQAQVSQSKAQLAEKEEEFRNSTIVSPLEGVV